MGTLLADLHTHSTASDGDLAPAELVIRAARQGLDVIALTDHDTTAGIPLAAAAASAVGIRLIGGVEISTDVPTGELHVLGYGVDTANPAFMSALETFRDSSRDRLRLMLDRLKTFGIELPESIIAPSEAAASVGRPHVARALVAAGYAASIGDAFQRYLAEGRPAYVRKTRIVPSDAVRLVLSAGGMPVLAHPLGVAELDQRLPLLLDAGLVGIECYYSEYEDQNRESLALLADSLGLIATGGSDFHGDQMHDGRVLGSVQLPQARIFAFLDAYDSRHRRTGERAIPR